MRWIFRAPRIPPTPRARIFSKNFGSFSQSFEFSSTPSACKIFSERPGGRDPSAVKVSARYDAWRLQKRRKTETEKSANFERTFTPRGWLRSAWEFGKTRFRWVPTFDFSTLKKKNRSKIFGRKFFGRPELPWAAPIPYSLSLLISNSVRFFTHFQFSLVFYSFPIQFNWIGNELNWKWAELEMSAV